VVFVFLILSMDFNLSFAENNEQTNTISQFSDCSSRSSSFLEPSQVKRALVSSATIARHSNLIVSRFIEHPMEQHFNGFVICRPKFLYNIFVVRHQIAAMSYLRYLRQERSQVVCAQGWLPCHVCKPTEKRVNACRIPTTNVGSNTAVQY